LARSRGVRAQRRADLGVVEVIAVAQDDCRPLGRGKLVGEVLELGEGRAAFERGKLRQLCIGPWAAMLVDRNAARDRVGPGPKVLAVPQLRVGAQGFEKGFLEGVVGTLPPESSRQERVDLLAVLVVEALERRQAHVDILKRRGRARCEDAFVRVAVVGHVEWVEFVRVEAVPRAGEIAHALETWEEPAGGGAVAAVQFARLAGSSLLFTALGSDELGRRSRAELGRFGVEVRAIPEPEPTRRAFTFVDEAGERTITVLGEKLRPRGGDSRLPWRELAGADAVYFVSGDAEALRHSRSARVLVATARELATLREGGVELDALVGSGEDEGELYRPGDLDPPPRVIVTTSGGLGGWVQPGGPFRPAPLPGPIVDAYGCGDSFAAGLTYALARGDSVEEAVGLAARCGAAVMTGRGPYAAQLDAEAAKP
jgi:ribokinase